MRVGFLISGSLDMLTGGYIYDRQIVDYLSQNGHQVEIIHLPGREYRDRLLQSFRSTFLKELEHRSLDVLLQDELDHPALIFLNRKLTRQARYPVVSIVHNLHSCELRAQWQNQLYRRIEKYYLSSVDGFIYNSHTTRRAVENLIGKPLSGVIAYPCGDRFAEGITECEIKSRAYAPGPLRILFLGNLFRNKGLHILLAALTNLPDHSYFLTVSGDLAMDVSYVKTIREQVRKNNLKDRVLFTGALNNGELVTKLRQSHVLVVPSFYEGFGMAFLEGMGFGLPAIGTTAGAVSEIISHGQNGFLITPGDSSTLSQYLLKLNNDRDRLVSMSLRAWERFSAHPGWQNTCQKILDFLLDLHSASSSPIQ